MHLSRHLGLSAANVIAGSEKLSPRALGQKAASVAWKARARRRRTRRRREGDEELVKARQEEMGETLRVD